MNSMSPFVDHFTHQPKKMAICDHTHGVYSFNDLKEIAIKVQSLLYKKRLKPGDTVLVTITPSPILYGVLCGLVGYGIQVLFIEPWMSISKINHVINITNPQAYFTNLIGVMWGGRSQAIRHIKHWITTHHIFNETTQYKSYHLEKVNKDHPAYIVFSSGTTGMPKGIKRTHGFMTGIGELFEQLEPQNFNSPDLVLFPNVALFHLGTGRGSIILPQNWKITNLVKTLELCKLYKPETLSLNPAFLNYLVENQLNNHLSFIKRIVVGGALNDCNKALQAFKQFNDCNFLQLYGGSEAEPISVINAQSAVKYSQNKGYFQTVCLGTPIEQIKHKLINDQLWVSGPNVASEYIGDISQNNGIKFRDQDGVLWHNMNDRIYIEDNLMWFKGRSNQDLIDFELEQQIYQFLNTSNCFIHYDNGFCFLIGEKINHNTLRIRKKFPQIDAVINAKIIRDDRHRSRINRAKSIQGIKL